jgi:hypothetical protein
VPCFIESVQLSIGICYEVSATEKQGKTIFEITGKSSGLNTLYSIPNTMSKKSCLPVSRILFLITKAIRHLSFICDTGCPAPVTLNPSAHPAEAGNIARAAL